jgi:hypothetical protein
MPGVPNSNAGNEACGNAEDYLHDGVELHGDVSLCAAGRVGG